MLLTICTLYGHSLPFFLEGYVQQDIASHCRHHLNLIPQTQSNRTPFVADQQSATPPTQVSSTRPRAGNKSTAIQSESGAATVFVSACTKPFQDLTLGLSYCYTLMGNVPEPALSREIFLCFVCLPFCVFLFPPSAVSSSLTVLPPVPDSTAPHSPIYGPRPEPSQLHLPSPLGPRSPHKILPSSWHFIRSGPIQLNSPGSHSFLRRLSLLRQFAPDPRLYNSLLNAYGLQLLSVSAWSFGSVLRSIKMYSSISRALTPLGCGGTDFKHELSAKKSDVGPPVGLLQYLR